MGAIQREVKFINMKEIETRYILSEEIFKDIQRKENVISKDELMSYYFDSDNLSFYKNRNTLKIRKESNNYFIYFKSASENIDQKKEMKERIEEKKQLSIEEINSLILHGISNKKFKEIFGFDINVENLHNIGKIKNNRYSLKCKKDIYVFLDSYEINEKKHYCIEFECNNYENINEMNSIIEDFKCKYRINHIDNTSKFNMLVRHILYDKLKYILLENIHNIDFIIIYSSSLEGVGSSQSDFDVYVSCDNKIGDYQFEFYGKEVDLEIFDYRKVMTNCNLDYLRAKFFHRILIGEVLYENNGLSIFKKYIHNQKIYDYVYNYRINTANSYFDDAKKFKKSNYLKAAIHKYYFAMYYFMLAYIIKKGIKVMKEKWLIYILEIYMSNDMYAKKYFDLLNNLFEERCIEDKIKKIDLFCNNIIYEIELS